MRYHGGKVRKGKKVATIINKILEDGSMGYIEPFCGMCGVLRHIRCNNTIIAADINESVIDMWNSLRDGWIPDLSCVDEEYYNNLKVIPSSSPEKGFFGHALSFGGLYFQTFMVRLINLLPYSRDDVVRISKDVSDVIFIHGDFKTLFSECTNCVIFCDPPYEKYNRYYDQSNNRLKFDHDIFWEWCNKMTLLGNAVIVIENIEFFGRVLHSNVKVNHIPICNRVTRYGKTRSKVEEIVGIFSDYHRGTNTV